MCIKVRVNMHGHVHVLEHVHVYFHMHVYLYVHEHVNEPVHMDMSVLLYKILPYLMSLLRYYTF